HRGGDRRKGAARMSFLFNTSNAKNSNQFSGVDNTNQATDFTQTGNGTTTPVNPQWVTDASSGIYGGGATLAGENPASFVAGPNDLLKTANNNALNLSGTPWAFDAGTDLTRSVGQMDSPDISSMIGKFTDPYTKQV